MMQYQQHSFKQSQNQQNFIPAPEILRELPLQLHLMMCPSNNSQDTRSGGCRRQRSWYPEERLAILTRTKLYNSSLDLSAADYNIRNQLKREEKQVGCAEKRLLQREQARGFVFGKALNLGDSPHFDVRNFIKRRKVFQSQGSFYPWSTFNFLLSSLWQICNRVIHNGTAPNKKNVRNYISRVCLEINRFFSNSYLPPVSNGASHDMEIDDPVVAPFTKPTPVGGEDFLRFVPQCK